MSAKRAVFPYWVAQAFSREDTMYENFHAMFWTDREGKCRLHNLRDRKFRCMLRRKIINQAPHWVPGEPFP